MYAWLNWNDVFVKYMETIFVVNWCYINKLIWIKLTSAGYVGAATSFHESINSSVLFQSHRKNVVDEKKHGCHYNNYVDMLYKIIVKRHAWSNFEKKIGNHFKTDSRTENKV